MGDYTAVINGIGIIMVRLHNFAAALCLSSSLFTLTAHASSTVSQSGYTPLYLGVDQETATVDGNHANIVRVDLTAPGIQFATTPHAGSLSTVAQPLSKFVSTQGLQLAINANFFSPCCSTTPQAETVIGLAVDRGHLIAPPSYDPLNSSAVLAITRHNHASIVQLTNPGSLDLSTVYNAVAGSAIVVADGANVAVSSPNEGDPNNPNPRTLVGLSHDARFLYFVTIDGRVTGYSLGTTNAQSADLMIAVGCDRALNLDGGGSTEMVSETPGKPPFIVNNLSGGAEREDGSAIGFTAIPLPSQTLFDYTAIDLLLKQLHLGG